MSIKYIFFFNYIQIIFNFCLFFNSQQYEITTSNSLNQTDSLWNGTCYRDIDCTIPRSICQNNECVCPEKYPIYSNSKCNLGWGYFESCDTYSGECEMKIVNGRCINNICRCPNPQEDYVFDNGKCVPVHQEHCLHPHECGNKECIYGHCLCSEGFLNIGKECIKAVPLLRKCFSTLECRLHDANSLCKNGTCDCKNGTTYIKNFCLSTEAVPIDGRCKIDDQCLQFTDHSECFNGKCRCITDNVFFYGNKCLTVSFFGHTCNISKQCTQDVYQSQCINGLCQCPWNLPYLNSLYKQCTSYNLETSTSKYCYNCYSPFTCVSGKCECGKEKPIHYNGNCYPNAFLGGHCDVNKQCSIYDENSECKNSYCVCKGGYQQKFGNCYMSANIGEVCSFYSRCDLGDINSECILGRCACKNGYHFDKKCIPLNNNVSPSVSWLCFSPKQFIDGECICVYPTPVEISGVCHNSASFGKKCLFSSQCSFEDLNSECHLGLCRCKAGYTFAKKCIPSYTDGLYQGSCYFEFDCHFPFSTCDNGICVCKHGYIYQNERCLVESIKNDSYNGLENLQTALWILVALFSVLMAICFISKCRKSINRTSYMRRSSSLTNQLLESIPSSSHLVNIPSYEELYPNYRNTSSPENAIPHAVSHIPSVPLRTNQEEQNFEVSNQPTDIPVLTDNSHTETFHSIITEDDKIDDVPVEHVNDHHY